LTFNSGSKQISTDFAPSPKWMLELFKDFLDVCPSNPQFNGLEIPWEKRNYCNPPYSDKIPWIKKAIKEKEKGNFTIMLLPHAPGAAWYHDLIIPNAEILSLRGRLQLDNGKHPRTDSMLVIFH